MVAFAVLFSVLAVLTANALASPLTFYKNVPGPAEAEVEGNVICPGGDQQCPIGNTCCITEVAKYGCCPHLNAVCCRDKMHCCPNGGTCDLTNGKCLVVADTHHPLVALVTQQNVENVICPNHKEECPSGQTCCLTGTDKYGCCPHANAVCCTDKMHCCPSGYRCNGSKCVGSDAQQHPLLTLSMLARPEKQEIECPGGKETCTSDETCCPYEDRGYGCCQHVKGVCCTDKKHCCPEGFTCNPSAGLCTKGSSSSSHPLLEILPQRPSKQEKELEAVSDNPNPVICGNGVDTCPTGNTCCYNKSQDKYGCCPSYNAVCCNDGQECCPSGYLCDAKEKTCKMAGLQQFPFMKIVLQ